MPAKLIISDVDGCLSPEESIPWDLEHFQAFARRAREAAAGEGSLPPITLCTGRPQPYCEVLMKLLDIRHPVICENGAVIYTLHDNHARYAPGVTEENVAGLRAVVSFLERDVLPREPEAVLQYGKMAQLSVFSKDPAVLPTIAPKIEAFVEKRGGPRLVINVSHYYLNVSLEGVDKGSALRAILEELGLERNNVVGIGDTEGDMPLHDAVGFFACPSNAHGVILDAADYVSPYPVLEGVLDILDRPEFQRG